LFIIENMKRTFQIIVRFIGALLLFVVLYLLCAYALGHWGVNNRILAKGDIPVYILTNGVHTDIVVPLRNSTIDWSREIKFSNTHRKDTLAQWLGFGWGDKGFYLETPTWNDLKFSTAFRAMFGLSHTAIHATFHNKMPLGENSRLMHLSAEQYQKLVEYIKNTLQLDENRMPVYIATNANYSNDDAFYEANGSYSLFHTCNTWTNNALKACGQRACLWTPFDKGIFYQHPPDQ
jgi:uncharacterized protein (TIGR02117 family)